MTIKLIPLVLHRGTTQQFEHVVKCAYMKDKLTIVRSTGWMDIPLNPADDYVLVADEGTP